MAFKDSYKLIAEVEKPEDEVEYGDEVLRDGDGEETVVVRRPFVKPGGDDGFKDAERDAKRYCEKRGWDYLQTLDAVNLDA